MILLEMPKVSGTFHCAAEDAEHDPRPRKRGRNKMGVGSRQMKLRRSTARI